ncbi:MAG: transcriptional regulator [Bradyrhizobium sp.]|jgi:hypothetical protein|uniref:transcriptional regulator n=1 Tax=Bradyrhizobium sp. TaxID=376 RepID=UPI002720E28E|nr:transcriptional regulator [Bradyrhizobium sp.]MDO8397025.1 transcriptional regulator [Bradyrhizobium sp.]MDO9295416.1 transcriptional regulator [Bradyrhizobium sp.]MDP1582512.1 transcriptional regulator [Bradyrhizobium sp.]
MDDEPKTPAELKEIRLNRRAAQDAEGIKAMADIAAADIAIRKRTATLREERLAREAADREKPPEPKAKAKPKKKKTT